MSEIFERWVAALEQRHLADLTLPEVSRALRSLSATYVERRQRIREGAALSGAGKRAAFALFYGPLHYLLVQHVVAALPGATSLLARSTLVDLGCGTGASGAAWASSCAGRPNVLGIDRHAWAAAEAAATYKAFGLSAKTIVGDVTKANVGRPRAGVLAAFTLNEIPDPAREQLLARLVARTGQGDDLLVVEPLAGFVAPWWKRWQATVESHGGRADEWRVRAELPAIVAKLDAAAGLDHREITGRSLWIPGRRNAVLRFDRAR